jgi:HAMP domain-containing protein
LSDRYLADRKQPDKSIDLVDEACSSLRLEQESKPENIWKVERDLLTKQIELSALQNEDDDEKTIARKTHVQEEVDALTRELNQLNEEWQAEKKELERRKVAQEELEEARTEMEAARRRGDYNKAGELLHSTIPRLEHELEDMEADIGKKGKMLADAVTAEAIANIVARHTGIPVSRITGSESRKLLSMENKLREVSCLVFCQSLPHRYFFLTSFCALRLVARDWTRSSPRGRKQLCAFGEDSIAGSRPHSWELSILGRHWGRKSKSQSTGWLVIISFEMATHLSRVSVP